MELDKLTKQDALAALARVQELANKWGNATPIAQAAAEELRAVLEGK